MISRLLFACCFALAGMLLSLSASAGHLPLNLVKGYGQVLKFYTPIASVFVGSNEIAEVQAINEKSIYISGLKAGSTNLLVMDYDNNVIRSYSVTVALPNDETGAVLNELVPRNSITLKPRGKTAILQGKASSVDEALGAVEARKQLEHKDRIVIDQTTTTAPVQVALKVRIVELYKRDLLSLGFDISAIGSGSVFRVVTGTGIAEDFVKGTVGNSFGSSRAGGKASVGQVDVNAMIDLLERNGLVKVVAEPMLTTTTGEKATFRSGGEFAVPVNQGDGVFVNEYKDTGITVEFLPKILPNDRISVEVSPEIVYVDPRSQAGVAPSLLVRSVETKVDVASGQTFAIAGLYELFESSQTSGTPGASKIPLIGKFLTNSNKTKDERELVFFITPYLVKSSSVVEKKKEPHLMDTLGFIVE